MRTVARFQATTSENPIEAFHAAKTTLLDWKDTKFALTDGSYVIRKTNCPATVNEFEIAVGDRTLFQFDSVESSNANSIGMIASLYTDKKSTSIQIDIKAGNPKGYINLTKMNVQSPKFFKDIIAGDFNWHFRDGGDKILASVLHVNEGEIDVLVSLLLSENRRLPVFLVSQVDGMELVSGVSKRLNFVSTGLAHVCTISEGASWALSEALGDEWSVYGKAIRLYWPMAGSKDSPFRHKYWTRFAFSTSLLEDDNADWRVAKIVSRSVVSVSGYLPEFHEIAQVRRDYQASELAEQAAKAREDQDYDKLEKLYAKENDRLALENKELQTENENLKALLSTSDQVFDSEVIEAGDGLEGEYQTVREAVDRAKAFAGKLLVFPDRLEDQLTSITETPSLPAQVFFHLKTLRDLADALRSGNGSIGKTSVQWLKDNGVETSGESETKRGSGLHQFAVGGKIEEFELHTKVTDGTSPDRCVRIYFRPSEDFSSIKIGMIGSKKLIE